MQVGARDKHIGQHMIANVSPSSLNINALVLLKVTLWICKASQVEIAELVIESVLQE
uniref:Uncharacterized protein n=1 Tax=Rhizophora mucronata TaxID=61149 RepID=A0A2P2PLN6_RHIMU